jgi:hypothetical protein
MEPDPIDEKAEALQRIDATDFEAHDEARQWAADELVDGRSPDDVIADLAGQGWDIESAEEITEFARKATRRQRGVVTRNDVARLVEAKHRKATTGMAAFFRSGIGLFAIFGFLTHLRETIKLNRQFKAMKKRREDELPPT